MVGKKVKLIIFDYDGVIVDSFPTVHNVYSIICEKLGYKCPKSFEKFKKIYGYDSRSAAKSLGFRKEDGAEIGRMYKDEIVKQNPSLFNGIVEVIGKLSEEYTLVLISSSPTVEVESKLGKFGLADKFQRVYGSAGGGPLNKIPVIREVLKLMDCKAEEVIMIGDRLNDYIQSVEAGLLQENIILVEYGWGYDKKKIPRRSYKVDKPKDLLKAVKIVEIGEK